MTGGVVQMTKIPTYDEIDALRRFVEAGVVKGFRPDHLDGDKQLFSGKIMFVTGNFAEFVAGQLVSVEETLREIDKREVDLVARWN